MSQAGNSPIAPPGKLFVISGPSGSGKSTITREVVQRTGSHLSVSATTRPRSEREVEGVDYYFIDREVFEEKIAGNEFLEYAQVFDNYYGTPAGPVRQQLSAGRKVVLEIDVQGGLQVFGKMPEACGILILPPSMDELRRRLVSRRRDSEAVIQKRLEKAQWEIEKARASGCYIHSVTNDDLDRAINQVIAIFNQ